MGMGMGKKIFFAALLLSLVAGCQAEIAGPIPEYREQNEYTSPHRRIPQSEHSLTGSISDVHLEVLKNSERLHIGDRNNSNNDSLPAYEIYCTEQSLRVRVYARNVQNSLWQDKFEGLVSESPLVNAISWQMGEDNLYAEFLLELSQPVIYRTWYYVNACFFTIEFTAKTQN